VTTELGSFDASRLGAFRASQFGDARNAGHFNQFNVVLIAGYGRWSDRSEDAVLFDLELAHFNDVVSSAPAPIINALLIADWVMENGGVLPVGREFPPGVQVVVIDTQTVPPDYDITPAFEQRVASVLGEFKPPSAAFDWIGSTSARYTWYVAELVAWFEAAYPAIVVFNGTRVEPSFDYRTPLRVLADLITLDYRP